MKLNKIASVRGRLSSDVQNMPLEKALVPTLEYHVQGIAEEARALAEKNAECIGRLLALLVDKKVIEFEEAVEVIDTYCEIKLVDTSAVDELIGGDDGKV